MRQHYAMMGLPAVGLLAVGLLTASCGDSDSPASPPDPFVERQIPAEYQEDLGPLAAGNTAFALDLYKRVSGGTGNVILCPFSISAALGMTWAGARTQTETEMADVLRFSLPQERLHPLFGALIRSLDTGATLGGYRLSIANRLWGMIGYPWLPEFLDLTGTNYGAPLQEMDFAGAPEASREEINGWVEERTEGKIEDLLPVHSITPATVLVLTNAIYFKGNWLSSFDPEYTSRSNFKTMDGRTVAAEMMEQTWDFRYHSAPDLQVLALDYEGGDLSMILLLPQEPDGLPDLEASLTPDALDGWIDALEMKEVAVRLPRFEITSEYELNRPLIEAGMPSAFDAGADFSGMNGMGGIWISLVVHKAFIKVNEEGTEAAGATGVIIIESGSGPENLFSADRPFLYLIRDNVTGSVLFMGRVADPTG